MIDDPDQKHLERCVEVASDALRAWNEPFGSALVSRDGGVLFKAFNQVGGGEANRRHVWGTLSDVLRRPR
ncbi:hypothetical protein [Fulvimarina endophytica]|uniref:hypothetical protein n=1 Tax=Fulvimarina endophytica TaxID=2293836 RepID=UPI001AECCF43|nr:hypothetical protein [Fulvimarina endophytica]